jgi:hypothetical protein
MTIRRFPPPWTVVEENAACFIVKNHAGLSLAYVYFEEEPGPRAATRLMTRYEARRIAANIAKLPELLGKTSLAPPLRMRATQTSQPPSAKSTRGIQVRHRSRC